MAHTDHHAADFTAARRPRRRDREDFTPRRPVLRRSRQALARELAAYAA